MSTIWSLRRQTYFVSLKRLYERVLYFFKTTRKKCNWFWKEKSVTVNKEELKSHQDGKAHYVCGKRIIRNRQNQKVRNYYRYTDKYRCTAHSICILKFKAPNEIPVVFHNSSNYDYYFIIKELANKYEGNLGVLGKKKEKYKIFAVPIKR